MRIGRLDDETIALAELDSLCCDLLRRISASAESDDAAAQTRIYSSPSGGADPEMEEDWRQYVHPDLHELFASAVDVVRGDLASIAGAESEDGGVLHVPVAHVEAWIHTLNQARLALAATHDFTEKEMSRMVLASAEDPRAFALLQVHFYGLLLEYFLHEAAP